MSDVKPRGAQTRSTVDRYAPSQQARQSRATGLPKASRRRMSSMRRLWYGLLVLLARGCLRLLWSTCRIRAVLGTEQVERLAEAGQPAIFAYWHQHHIFASWYLVRRVRRGLKLGFLTSPSVSGEVPAAIIRRWGALPVRGSSTRSAGETLRELFELVGRQRHSLAITADGPKGPLHEFKPGAILLAKMSKAPIVPMSYAARRSIRWRSWDRFVVPMPFTSVVIVVGDPVEVPAGVSVADPSPLCRELEETLAKLNRQAREALG